MKESKCIHCNNIFLKRQIANHTRWCNLNPQKQDYLNTLKKNRTLTQYLESRKQAGKKIKQRWEEGAYNHCVHGTFKGKRHTIESKQKMSEKALKSTHRRLVKSTRKYLCTDGTEVLLDSSWEEALARRLDTLCIKWVRPITPIPWLDTNGRQHNYFPDFYLPDMDLYLDPKNPFAYRSQIEKILIITKQIKNLIIIKTLDECNTFTGNLI